MRRPVSLTMLLCAVLQEQLKQCREIVDDGRWDDLRFILSRINGPPGNVRQTLYDAVALTDGATAAKAEPLAGGYTSTCWQAPSFTSHGCQLYMRLDVPSMLGSRGCPEPGSALKFAAVRAPAAAADPLSGLAKGDKQHTSCSAVAPMRIACCFAAHAAADCMVRHSVVQ
jgi:hypothetical protein